MVVLCRGIGIAKVMSCSVRLPCIGLQERLPGSSNNLFINCEKEVMMGSNCVDVIVGPEQLCYIPCNFCNIILAVSVPCSSLFDIVTVRCGHCTNLWSVNMAVAFQSAFSRQDFHHHHQVPNYLNGCQDYWMDHPGSSSKVANRMTSLRVPGQQPREERVVNRPPEKKQRVPSAYNQFIKEEIQRIKANNPDISHREAFSTAAKNWAHFPHIHFGLMLETNNNQTTRFDQNNAAKRLMSKGAGLMKK